jgi:endoglucanase
VLVAAAGAADAAGQTAARDGLLDDAEALDRRSPTYYGDAWVALGRTFLTTRLLDDTCS